LQYQNLDPIPFSLTYIPLIHEDQQGGKEGKVCSEGFGIYWDATPRGQLNMFFFCQSAIKTSDL